MRTFFLPLFCLISIISYSQKSISGTFLPAEDYSWLIAYRLKPGSQAYIADTSIKEGKFTLEIPKTAEPGTYRLVYAVPQDEFYFDVLYSGKEDIVLEFNSDTGPLFTTSKENILFGTYFNEIGSSQQKLFDFYSSGKTNKNEFSKLSKSIAEVQELYEEKSKGLRTAHFIKANRPYIPTTYETAEEYIGNKKKSYFKELDFNDPVIQGSDYLLDKLRNYVFTALPLKELSASETEVEIQQNINSAAKVLQDLSIDYQFDLFHSIWKNSSDLKFDATADFIFDQYLKPKAQSEENKNIVTQIEASNRLRIGKIAPELEWQSKGVKKKLSSLTGGSNYLLIFWSSTCSHCLKELPVLHKELKKWPNVQVIAIGLEDDDLSWKLESEKMASFEHLIALGKWDSNYAELYDIHQTPTYFMLDTDKRIISKPESDRAIIEFLER